MTRLLDELFQSSSPHRGSSSCVLDTYCWYVSDQALSHFHLFFCWSFFLLFFCFLFHCFNFILPFSLRSCHLSLFVIPLISFLVIHFLVISFVFFTTVLSHLSSFPAVLTLLLSLLFCCLYFFIAGQLFHSVTQVYFASFVVLVLISNKHILVWKRH